MQYQYVVSAHKSSSVVSAASGAFVSPDSRNLLISRGSRLQVMRQQQTASGHLDPVNEYTVNGHLHHMEFLHPADRSTGYLLLVSSKRQFALVAWDEVAQNMVTESTGEFIERTGRPSTRPLVAVDPMTRMFAVNAYQGIVHLFPMGKSDQQQFAVPEDYLVGGLVVPEYLRTTEQQQPTRGRRGKNREHMAKSTDIQGVSALYVDELKIIDMCFVRDAATPQLAILYEDADMMRRVRVYQVTRVRGELQLVAQTSWTATTAAARLVALPKGAVGVLGHAYLAVCHADGKTSTMATGFADVCGVCWVDQEQRARLLVADSSGTLTLVAFGDSVPETSRLGSVPVASCLTYVGDGCVFVGSHCGDSLLIRLHQQLVPLETASLGGALARKTGMRESGSFVETLEAFSNLAPVVDLCVVGQGQGQKAAGSVVACSGLRTTPALRMVRNGVGVAEIAGTELAGVLRVWALAMGGSQMDVDNQTADRRVLVVASMAAHTMVLGWTEEEEDSGDSVEMAELAPCAWVTNEPTLAAAAASDGCYAVQATVSAVLLLDNSGRLVSRWVPASGMKISAASVYGGQIVLAVGATVHYVEMQAATLVCVATSVQPADVSCLDIHAWEPGRQATHVAVGLWAGQSVHLLTLPTLATTSHPLVLPGDGGLPRSILQCTLGGTRYVLVGLGDGRLHHFALTQDGFSVAEHKCVTLGTHPLALTPFVSRGALHVFAASDHSAVLFASATDGRRPARLMYANVDAMDVGCVAALHGSIAFPDALCLVSPGRLWIGRPDPVQNLHVRTHALPAWAEPVRVAFNQSVYGLATVHPIDDASEMPWGASASLHPDKRPVEYGRFSVLDSQSMEVVASLLLDPFEQPQSLCAVSLQGAAGTLDNVFVLGTSVVMPGDDDARSGRLVVFSWDTSGRRLSVVGEFSAAGAVYAVEGFRGMVLATVANRLLLLGWQSRKQPGVHKQVSSHVYIAHDVDNELVILCSQQTQIAALSLAIAGDFIVVGDILASASLYHYQNDISDTDARYRLVPLARDAAGVWTTAIGAVPPPLAHNHRGLLPPIIDDETGPAGERQKLPSYNDAFLPPSCNRYLVSDAYHNIIRLASVQTEHQPADGANIQEHRLVVEGRWHLGDQINVIRPGSLVMDIPDPEFPDCFRPQLVYGTLNGSIGVMASVENGKLGRILDRLQVNMAQMLPTPGLWSYQSWRAYSSDKRDCDSFGFLDGDLIEGFLDLSTEMQQLVVSGGGALLDKERRDEAERLCKLEYWKSFSKVEGEAECRCLAQMAVSDICQREGVSLDFVKRLVESLTRLH
ncbi:DNA damage-binding protein 1a [Coemansia sp. RSA 486]|nr:DNA damage-binding protein 1a [Coemansia sp. RSA 486]KAJ2236344.1 DNA damage-binding protein 1a [Coemansia sp. RSA 485]